jgi:hypothetical protein
MRRRGTEQDQNGKVENMSENIFGGYPQTSRNPLKVLVPRAGIEPATRGFSIRCSTN